MKTTTAGQMMGKSVLLYRLTYQCGNRDCQSELFWNRNQAELWRRHQTTAHTWDITLVWFETWEFGEALVNRLNKNQRECIVYPGWQHG